MKRSSGNTKTKGSTEAIDWLSARDAIRHRVSIQQVLNNIGVETEPSGGTHVKALCPLHGEDSPSFYVNVAKDLFFCHGCSTGGDLFKFVELKNNIGFTDAVKWLAHTFNVDLSAHKRQMSQEELKTAAFYRVNEKALEFWRKQDQTPLKKWIEKRGLPASVITQFDLAYASKSPTARDLGTDDATVEALGLNRGFFSSTVAIPLFDLNRRIAGFRYRFINPKKDGPNTISPSGDHPLPIPAFYGLQNALPALRQGEGKLVVVEGEPDVWAVSAGWPAVVGAMGVRLSEEFIRDDLDGYGVRDIVLTPDGDKAGIEWALRTAEKSGSFAVNMRFIQLPEGLDPDDFILKKGQAAFVKLVRNAPYLSEWAALREIDQQKTNTEKLDYITSIRDIVNASRPIEAELIMQTIADRFKIETYVVDDFLKRTESQTGPDYTTVGERIVLAAAIGDHLARYTITAQVGKDAFFSKRHSDLFEVIVQMEEDKTKIGWDTVKSELNKLAMSSIVSTVEELEGLDFKNYEYHLKDVREKAMRRAAVRRLDQLRSELTQSGNKPRIILETGVSDLSQLAVHEKLRIQSSGPLVEATMQTIAERMRSPNLIIGWDLGREWFVLNRILLGLQHPRYFVVAAPQGTGKTAFAGNIVKLVAGGLRVPTLWCTFEMPPEMLQYRMLSSLSGVFEDNIKAGLINSEQMNQISDAAAKLHAMPIYWSQEGRYIEAFEPIVRSYALRHKVKFVVVDYLQLMYSSGERGARYLQLEHISGRIQELAYELDICVLALCQINREGAKSSLAKAEDVGGAYRITQDADHLLILQEKSPDEIEADGMEMGNLRGFLDKNRYGRGDILFPILYEKETLRMREVLPPNARS